MPPIYSINSANYVSLPVVDDADADMAEHALADHTPSSRVIGEPLFLPQASTNRDAAVKSLITITESLCRGLDRSVGDLLATLRDKELPETEKMLATLNNMLEQGAEIPFSTSPGTPEHQLALHLRQELRDNPAGTFYERGRRMIDFIGAVMRNDFTVISDGAPRRIANVISVATRTGTIVAFSTLLRQMVGFALENNFRLLGATASLPPRLMAGVFSMLLGPGLNLAGGIRDEMNGTATNVSRASRISMGMISAGALVVMASHKPDYIFGTLMGSIGVQTLTYTLMRDLLQLFFPLHDNGGINVGGLVSCSLFYGVAQVALGVAMAEFAPHSGAGYAIDEAARIGKHMAAWASAAGAAAMVIQPNIIHDLLRSAFNALAEAFDELQRPTLMNWLSTSHDGLRPHNRTKAPRSGREKPPARREGVRIGLRRPRIGNGYWPTADQAAEQFLTTNAMRTSNFTAAVGVSLTAASVLGTTRLSHFDQMMVINHLVAAVLVVGYPPFVGAHVKQDAAPAPGHQ